MFFRKMVREIVTACVEAPATVAKYTFCGGVTGAGIGAFWGDVRSSQVNSCEIGQYILNYAVDYHCIASGNACPHYGEGRDPDPLTINCFGNKTAETNLEKAAAAYGKTLPIDVHYIIVSSLIGFGVGAVCGFIVGVKVANDRIAEEKTPALLSIAAAEEPLSPRASQSRDSMFGLPILSDASSVNGAPPPPYSSLPASDGEAYTPPPEYPLSPSSRR